MSEELQEKSLQEEKEETTYEEEMQAKAKEQSQVMLKTVFRFAACVYLIWLGGGQMLLKYIEDPASHSIGYVIFGVFFVLAGGVYLVYALRVYLADAKKRNEELEAAEAKRTAEQPKAPQMSMAQKARLTASYDEQNDKEEGSEQ